MLPEELIKDKRFLERFNREAETIANLEHPAIVPVYDYGEEDGRPYLVMRYMAGGSLREYLNQKGSLSIQQAAELLALLAPALDKAHAQGVIHRDIKPANILFDEDGNPHLSDFGIVKLAQADITLTGTQATVGTPAYMSPEQARAEKELDGRSDIYSLAVILFEMLTGKQPFKADTPMGLAVAHINDPIPQISNHRTDLSTSTQTIIERGLAKKRQERFTTSQELVAALKNLASAIERSDSETIDALVTGLQSIGWVRQSPKVVWFLGSIFLIIIIIVVSIIMVNSRHSQRIIVTVTKDNTSMQQPTKPEIPTLTKSSLATSTIVAQQPSATQLIEPTATETLNPTSTKKVTLSPTLEIYFPLPGCAASRLHLGDVGIVTADGGNHIRSEPNTNPSDNIVGHADQGAYINVIGGPECNYGWMLWEVASSAGERGWIAETDGKVFWIEPFPTKNACTGSQSSSLEKGMDAFVSTFSDAANRVREAPDTNATVIGIINPGEAIGIIDGPECADGYVWWKVRSRLGLTGWTIEGSGYDRWVIPEG